MLELRRRGRGDGAVRAGYLGESGPGEVPRGLLVFVRSESERRLAERERELVSLLRCREGPRGVVLLSAPGDDSCCWLCIAAGSQRVAARLCFEVSTFWWGVSSSEGKRQAMTTRQNRGPRASVHKAAFLGLGRALQKLQPLYVHESFVLKLFCSTMEISCIRGR